EPTNHLDMTSREVLENALNSYEGTVLYVSHDRYFINHTASRILSLTKKTMLNYPGNGKDAVPDRFMGNYDFYLEKSQEVEESLLQDAYAREQGLSYEEVKKQMDKAPAAAAPLSAGSADWKKQKEEQARLRKAASDLKKCEDRIAALEEESASIDEEMAKPEVCTDISRLTALSRKKEELEEELAGLYEQWEVLSENA
ncbi:MAG: ABC-F family ATP-binding cassette domain-containing protein, partial [Lachnospiraceae bacterium]|nr:ABC-F family ATP-binding cassette domain-containing protein [Lachnospiraceae bacterium]